MQRGLKLAYFLKEGFETPCFSIHGLPSRPVMDSEGFQSGSEGSETVWFQRGFRVV